MKRTRQPAPASYLKPGESVEQAALRLAEIIVPLQGCSAIFSADEVAQALIQLLDLMDTSDFETREDVRAYAGLGAFRQTGASGVAETLFKEHALKTYIESDRERAERRRQAALKEK